MRRSVLAVATRRNGGRGVWLDSPRHVQGRAMRHPGFLLLPLLMLSDYLLTIAGARLRLETYERHFRTEHYELNPIWQQAVAKLRWFNPRHLLLTIVLTAIILFCVEWLL